MQATLKRNHQVYFLSSKLSKKLAALKTLKYMLQYGALIMVVEGMSNSVLVYC